MVSCSDVVIVKNCHAAPVIITITVVTFLILGI